jgi:DNA repair exonuclease SbcCD nuclease subunit
MSDIHLGHPRNETSDIVNNINTMLNSLSPAEHKELKYIFIAGDLFDRKIDMKSDSAIWAVSFWVTLCGYCEKNNIALRLLEGTPSHDHKQGKALEQIALKSKNLDFKYIETLYIEKHNELNILYVPDEWGDGPESTKEEVSALLAEKNLDKVDMAIMHGMFKYQAPVQKMHEHCHDEEFYLSIVKTFINIGHIHTYSKYNRIIAQGSVDRLAHNEEGKKGFCLMRVKGDELEHFFIENKNAKKFYTLHADKLSVEEIIHKLKEKTKPFKEGSYIQIKADQNHPVFKCFDELCKYFPYFNLTKNTGKELKLLDSVISKVSYTPLTITPEKINDMILYEVCQKHNLKGNDLDILRNELQDIKLLI